MRVVMIGASNLALTTAEVLLEEGAELVIVEKDRSTIEALSERYDCSFVHGDGSRPQILEDVGAEDTDCLFCQSSDDKANMLAAVVAKTMSFDRVVVRIEDQELLPISAQLELEHVIVPDRRVAHELVAFAHGDNQALSKEDPEADDD